MRAAADALANDAADPAAARAFYGLLYAAKALLNERGLRLHAHLRIAAGVDPPLRDWLTAAITRRRSGESEISYAEAEALLTQAHSALATARAQCTRRP